MTCLGEEGLFTLDGGGFVPCARTHRFDTGVAGVVGVQGTPRREGGTGVLGGGHLRFLSVSRRDDGPRLAAGETFHLERLFQDHLRGHLVNHVTVLTFREPGLPEAIMCLG